MLSLEQLKNLFLEQLDYTEDNDSILQPAKSDQLNVLRETVKNTTSLNQLGALLMVPRASGNVGFNPIEPFDKDALYYTPFQFDQAPLVWYFMYGNCGDFAYTFIIFGLVLCNPHITKKHNLSGNQACIYSVSGGYGPKGGPWVTIPYMFCQANYNVASQTTLSWKGIFDPTSPILNASFEALGVGNFNINVNWKDGNDMYGISSNMLSKQGPFLNGPKGCSPCIAGIGTSYYSYTYMQVSSSFLTKEGWRNSSGIGWFDHQWLQMGEFHDKATLAALSNVMTYFKTPTVTRWFWLSIQDTAKGIQYMTSIMPTDVLDPDNPLEMTTNSTIKYTQTDGPVYLSDSKTTVKVLQTVTVGDAILPSKHLVTIRDGNGSVTYILDADFGNSIVYLPSGVMNFEGSGTLYDETGSQILGNCFLEANQMETEDNILKTVCGNAGIKSDYNIFSLKNSKISLWVFTMSLLWLILVLIFWIFIFYLLYKVVMYMIHCGEHPSQIKA